MILPPHFMQNASRPLLFYLLLFPFSLLAQLAPLTVEKIMRDPKWMGVAPSSPYWSEDGTKVYFLWNPEKAPGDSLYEYTLGTRQMRKVPTLERRDLTTPAGTYNRARTQKVYAKHGDLYWLSIGEGKPHQLTNTVEAESNPVFTQDETHVVFQRGTNLYRMRLTTGEITQLTDFRSGKRPDPKPSDQEKWLKQDQLALFEVLRERADKKKAGEAIQKAERPKRPKEFYLEDRAVEVPQFSPDGAFVTFRLSKAPTGAKTAIVPSYVTESGFTEDLTTRVKVGAAPAAYQFFVYDIRKDTVLEVSTKQIPGLTDRPDYAKDYPKASKDTAKTAARKLIVHGPIWSEDGKNAVVVIRSLDNKDRWIMGFDPATRALKLLDRQRDEAWIGGPGVGGYPQSPSFVDWLADGETVVFHSEADGYSHLYAVNVRTGGRKQLTAGKFEVQSANLSKDRKTLFFTSNEVHPGEQHFYRMAAEGGERVRLTSMTGANDVTLSPDESKLLIRYSASNRPWELFAQDAKPSAKPEQVTRSTSAEFGSYPWREPQLVKVRATDGAEVYARLYVPKKKNGAAVIFVHGAGYLQNAHRWWSQYFREYLFHNLLADQGYTVLDLDYRASAGYGRDWRTGIYRHMGGKDLSDHIDGATWLVKNQGIDPKRIGIYGGSYGGFITLMALFTTPDVFAAGAALRPVTDWAAYNHPYTANILNEPQADSLAYRRSSPIYHAAGLKNHLLICHGLVDVNVHAQDVLRLSQRLIELKKDNWELALYPLEDHGFVEPSSWTDEYKRILKLFNAQLLRRR
jgi:dipeptidyl aminopeptidase/acylaminoacyl peptidase